MPPMILSYIGMPSSAVCRHYVEHKWCLPHLVIGFLGMIFYISAEFCISILQAEVFNDFTVDAYTDDEAEVAASLASIDSQLRNGYAWISEKWIRECSPLHHQLEWQKTLTRMISYARTMGWYDNETQRIRAHIEWDRTRIGYYVA